MAEYTANVDGVGTLRLLDAIKTCNMTDSVRFYQASTSELFGKVQEIPQKETTIFYPRSPYGNDYICTDNVGTCEDTSFFVKDQQLTDTESAVFSLFLCIESVGAHRSLSSPYSLRPNVLLKAGVALALTKKPL